MRSPAMSAFAPLLGCKRTSVKPTDLWVRALIPEWPDQCLSRRALHRDLGFEILLVAEDRCNCENFAVAAVAQDAILVADLARDRDVIPFLGVADIVDRDVVVLAPEERHRLERPAHPEHVERRGLALALR